MDVERSVRDQDGGVISAAVPSEARATGFLRFQTHGFVCDEFVVQRDGGFVRSEIHSLFTDMFIRADFFFGRSGGRHSVPPVHFERSANDIFASSIIPSRWSGWVT